MERMTRIEAINHIKTVSKHAIDSGFDSAVVDACAKAVKALEGLPAIRQAVWDVDITSPTIPEYREHHEQIQAILALIDKYMEEQSDGDDNSTE